MKKCSSMIEAKSVLNMLLEDSNLKPEEVMQNTCHVVTMTGKDLYLEVKDIQDTSIKISTFEQQREITTAVLYIQSDLSTAAAVSLSVDRKLKVCYYDNSPILTLQGSFGIRNPILTVDMFTWTCKHQLS